MPQDLIIKIPPYVQRVLTYLETSGFEAFVVGGCVRDSIMGIEPYDWDVCTSAKPKQIKEVFANIMPVVLTGEKHGTVTVMSEKNNVEVTTFRTDGNYTDSRHPESVTFVSSIEEDLSRRDFTMNAMAYNPKKGIVDIFGGKEDINNKVIRSVGDASVRFEEDALRIMRALRFSATLSFDIEDKTDNAIHKCRELLKNVSVERIYTEFSKLIMSEFPSKVLIKYRDVFGVIIPEVFLSDCNIDKQFEMMDILPVNINLRLAAALGAHGARDAIRVLKMLKTDNATRSYVRDILENSGREVKSDKISVKYMLKNCGVSLYRDILEYIKAKETVFNLCDTEYDKVISIIEEIGDNGECFSVKDLAINGSDLITLGIDKGPKVGQILDKVLNYVIEEKIENKYDVLVDFVNRNICAVKK